MRGATPHPDPAERPAPSLNWIRITAAYQSMRKMSTNQPTRHPFSKPTTPSAGKPYRNSTQHMRSRVDLAWPPRRASHVHSYMYVASRSARRSCGLRKEKEKARRTDGFGHARSTCSCFSSCGFRRACAGGRQVRTCLLRGARGETGDVTSRRVVFRGCGAGAPERLVQTED